MNHELYNDRIRNMRRQRRLFLEAVAICEATYDKAIDEKLDALLTKLDSECYVYMPEVTERDLAMDTYWDKVEQIEEVKEYVDSVEYRIRFEVMVSEAGSLLSELQSSCPDPEVDEVIFDWANEMADAWRYET